MKRNFKITLSIILVLTIIGTSVYFAFANDNSYTENAKFVTKTEQQIQTMVTQGQKFVVYIYSEKSTASQDVGNTVISDWMKDYGSYFDKIIGLKSDNGGFQEQQWIVPLYDDINNIGNGYINTPVVCFIDASKSSYSEKVKYYWCTKQDLSLKSDCKNDLNELFVDFYNIKFDTKTVTAVELVTLPDKLNYRSGESLNLSGISLRVTFSDNTGVTLYSGFKVSGFDSEKEGKKTVTVDYNGFTDCFEAIVSDITTFSYDVTYVDGYDMTALVNDLRTGKDKNNKPNAWYYKEGVETAAQMIESNKVYVSNLGKVRYDFDLEKAAKQRAAELAFHYSHTRPNGAQSFTAIDELEIQHPENGSYTYSSAAENIAYGADGGYKNVYEVFWDGWEQSGKNYDGQGHRRNMLKEDVDSFAAACAEYNGVKYWVQLFTKRTGTIRYDATDFEEEGTVTVKARNTSLQNITSLTQLPSYNLNPGDSNIMLPKSLRVRIETNEKYLDDESGNIFETDVDCIWESSDTNVASISNYKLTAIGGGNAVLTAKVGMSTQKINVFVSGDPYTTVTTTQQTTAKPTTTRQSTTAKPTTTQQSTTAKPTTTQQSTTAKPTTTQQPTTAKPTTTNQATTVKPTTTATVKTPKITIGNFANTVSVGYKANIKVKATIENAPSGATIIWIDDADNQIGIGEVYTKDKATSSFAVRAKITVGASAYISNRIEFSVNTGFFAKLKAFFQGLFGSLPTVKNF